MTWPTSRPGYPRDAERDGWHWLQVSDWPPHAEEWSAARREWKGYHGNSAFDAREGMRALIRYLGPCYTQADLDAAVAKARAEGMLAAAREWFTAIRQDVTRMDDEAGWHFDVDSSFPPVSDELGALLDAMDPPA